MYSVSDVNKINVFGRNIEIQRSHIKSGAALFTFNDICETLYGPNDYLAICKEYKHIFLENIPKLSFFIQRDEARRFIWLIDAMYETKCKLYCTSQRKPHLLFEKESSDDKKYQNIDVSMSMQQQETLGDLLGEMAMKSQEKDKEKENQDKQESKNIQSIFSGDEDLFAFKRAISRIYEMGTIEYENETHRILTGYSQLFGYLPLPQSVPPRHSDYGLSVSEKLSLPKPNVVIKDHHVSGYATWGEFASGVARALSRHTRRGGK